MTISNQSISFIFCAAAITSLTIASNIKAFPYEFRRLVKISNGEIVKIIDLISDIHRPEIPEQPNELGPSEKALLATLEKIGHKKTGETIEIIGETSSHWSFRMKYPRGLIGEYFLGPLWRTLMPSNGIIQILGALYLEFYEGKDKKLFYSHGDCYRNVLVWQDLPGWQEGQPFATETIRLMEKDLSSLKPIIDPVTYATLLKLLIQLKKYLSSSAAYRLFLVSNRNTTHIYNDCAQVTDHEILLKIISSEYKQNIVFAGGSHCEGVCQLLIDQFNFIPIKHVHNNIQSVQKKYGEMATLLNILHATKSEELETRMELLKEICKIRNSISDILTPLPADTWNYLLLL